MVVLPAPVKPTSATSSPGARAERDLVEHGAVPVVGEADPVKPDVPGDARRVEGVRGVEDFRCDRQDLAHAASAHRRLLQQTGRAGDF